MIQVLLPVIGKVLDRIIPDKAEAEKAKSELARMSLEGDLQALQADIDLAKAQILVNEKEAQTGDLFIAGWRPFIGWVCGGAFAWNFLVRDFTVLLLQAANSDLVVPPNLDLSEMMPVLLGMLGLGGFRTYEKLRGVARKELR